MASFFEIGSKIYHSNSMDTFGYTEQLEKMYRNKSTENEKTIFWFGIELVNGNDVEKNLCLLNMRVTGIPYRGMFVRWWQNGA